MKEMKDSRTSAQLSATNADHSAPIAASGDAYVKPRIEVVKLEMEQPLLNGGSSVNDPWNGEDW